MNLKECMDYCHSVRPQWRFARGKATLKTNVNHVLRIVGADTLIDSITTVTFVKIGNDFLDRGKQGATANRVMSALHTALTVAHEDGLLAHRPPKCRWFDEPDALRETYSKEELQTLINEAANEPDYGRLLQRSLLFIYLTGCRRSDMLRLKWKTVDFKNQQLTFIETKNGKPHKIKIHDELLPMLNMMHDERVDDEFVFEWGSCDRYNLIMGKLCRRIQIGGKRPTHQIRHTVATDLVDIGMDIKAIQALLNHQQIETTLLYANDTDIAKARAVDGLTIKTNVQH